MLSSTSIIRYYLRNLISSGKFDRVLENIDIIEATNGYLKATLKVSPEHTNNANFLHGGMSAMLIDQLTTMAFASTFLDPKENREINLKHENYHQTSIILPLGWPKTATICLNINYLNPLELNQCIDIKCYILKLSKNIAYLDGNIFNENNELAVKALHIKKIFS